MAKWTCTQCGTTETADVGLLVREGWWITEPAGGLCPPCVRKATFERNGEVLKRARRMRDEAAEMRRVASQMLETSGIQRRSLRS
jgi:hypothetical protein